MIALVFCGDLKYCPYINRYIERIENAGIDYKVYFWNRSNYSLKLDNHYIYYDQQSNLNNGKIQKFLDFVKYRNWLVQQFKKNEHDKIIVLSTLTGVFLENYLNKKRSCYIFDIRDYSYENIAVFYHIEKKIIKNSAFTAISSAGFRNFLPRYDYVIAHNFNRNEIYGSSKFKRTQGKINFVWNGVVRYFEFQKAYLDALKNDPRFRIVFHGDGPELILFKDYCLKNGFQNITFTGAYSNSEKKQLLNNAHILNNCYGFINGKDNRTKYAVSNRFYDGMIYHIPQLVEPEGYKPRWAKRTGLGVSYPPSERFADQLYSYYQGLDANKFDSACENEIQKIINEDDKYINMIDEFITK